MQICCCYCSQSPAEVCLEGQCQHSPARSQKEGLKHLWPKVVPLLTAKQRQARIKIGTAAQRSDTMCWRNIMITDSSIFRMHATGKTAGSWCTPATRGTVGRPKYSPGVHCYMGMTYWGVISLKFVTGTLILAQKYINPKTKRAYTGLGSKEYNDVLQQHLIPEVSASWQDQTMLQLIRQRETCNALAPMS